MTTIQDKYFEALKTKLKFTENDIECIGLKSKHGIYEISFYGCQEDNYTLTVEDFGRINSVGKWEQFTPTTTQMNFLRDTLRDAVNKLYEEKHLSEFNESEALKSAFTQDDYNHFTNLIYS